MLQSLLIIYFTKYAHTKFMALESCYGFQPRVYLNYMLYTGKASPRVLLIIKFNCLNTEYIFTATILQYSSLWVKSRDRYDSL